MNAWMRNDTRDGIAASRGTVRGPFAALMHSPDLAGRAAHLGTYIRFETTVPKQALELAILTIARHWDAHYEWAAHEIQAKDAGIRAEAVAAIRDRKAPEGLTDEEALTVKFALELLKDHKVSDATVNAVKDKLGLPPLVSPLERGGATRASVLTERTITATQKGGRLKVKIPIKGGSGRFRLLKGETKLTQRQQEVRRRIDEITAVHPDELRKDEEKLHEFYAEEVEAIIFNQPTLVKSKHRI